MKGRSHGMGPSVFDDRFSLESRTGALLNVYRAEARNGPRGVLLVHHGLAEHAGRYHRFAEEMASLGLAVYAHDHRGHGSTTAHDAPLRRFGRRNGPAKVLADCRTVHERALADHPGLPVILFGHSMGGLIALNYASRHGGDLAGVAIWNANFTYGLSEAAGALALRAERALKGSDVASRLFARATFEAWGKSVGGRRTMADWLSHDDAAVDGYIADPLCGWTPTVSMAADILSLIRLGAVEEAQARLPHALPIHLLGGGEDPATDGAKAVADYAGRLRLAGSRDVTLEIVAGARHDTLHEIDPRRAEALGSLTRWLNRILPVH